MRWIVALLLVIAAAGGWIAFRAETGSIAITPPVATAIVRTPATAAASTSALHGLPGITPEVEGLMAIGGTCRDMILSKYYALKDVASISGVHQGRLRLDFVKAGSGEVWSFTCGPRGNSVDLVQVDGIMEPGDKTGWEQNADGSLTFVDEGRRGPTMSSR